MHRHLNCYTHVHTQLHPVMDTQTVNTRQYRHKNHLCSVFNFISSNGLALMTGLKLHTAQHYSLYYFTTNTSPYITLCFGYTMDPAWHAAMIQAKAVVLALISNLVEDQSIFAVA